jgi:1,4-dihydroxy-2-naphthoyl-CoA synthase
MEFDANHLLMTTQDRAEGLKAFFGKRSPSFTGL